jgi:hydroxymethylpyrimidine/phosphomethylpyrimidine kinase|uniref:Phosphomethylpyrimidine kinase n=1 Tax=candidate division WOR-3 bacterium TaxID=2052148 RepID=A0A7C3YSZ1_UNCW3
MKREKVLRELKEGVRELEKIKGFAELIPEVRTNFAYARENPKKTTDVAAVDGRITVVEGKPKASGKVKFGASDHLARLLVEVGKYEKAWRCALNFKFDKKVLRLIKAHCQKKGIPLGKIERKREPKGCQKEERRSMVWKVKELYRSSGNRIPKIFFETAALGKEPLFVLLGRNPKEVLAEIKEILGG